MKKLPLILVLLVLVILNLSVQHVVCRWDMTDDKRYSISQPTRQLLHNLEHPLEVSILLDGELNAGFLRLKRATTEMVEELGVYAGKGVQIIPVQQHDVSTLEPTVIHERTHKGQTAQTTVYPYALVKYGSQTKVIPLLKNQRGLSGEDNLNNSIENLEYAFVEAIRGLTQTEVKKIAFLEGHGELDERYVYDVTQALAQYYQVDRGVLGTETGVLDAYEVIIIADPREPFSETDKYILDQYLMQGGRILWVVNGVRFSDDYLSTQGATPIIALDLNIHDMLFRYGVRVNHVLVQDLQCLPVPVDVSQNALEPNWQPMPWTFAPLLLTSQSSPITRNVAQINAALASSIDVVGGEDGIRKEVLLATSSNSKTTGVPARVDLSFGVENAQSFHTAFIPVALSLEGVFSSLYAYQLPPEQITTNTPTRKQSVNTRQIVVAAGSIIRNEWQQGHPLPLGYDRYTQMQFGNRDFIVNSVLYLADEEGWMQLRQKEIALRMINDQRARQLRVVAQIVSALIPILLLFFVGAVVTLIRRKKYIKHYQ